jgi:two-component system nitrate/nitrite response regulator NarL
MAVIKMDFLEDSPEGEVQDSVAKPGAIRVILADSQAIYRVGIRKVFALEDDVRVVAQADSIENLHAAVQRYPTDVVLLEGGMLTGTANAIPELLVKCVRKIAGGETWIDNQSINLVIEAYRSQAAALVSPRSQPRLSPKEMAIITCITQGKRNKEIAYQLGTTEQVIKNYLRKIYDKLGVSDRLELALYCLHHKIIQGEGQEESIVAKVVSR